MKIRGAVVTDQGKEFAIVSVTYHEIHNPEARDAVLASCQQYFSDIPIVLKAPGAGDTVHYHGQSDLVDFLTSNKIGLVDWTEYGI